LSSGQQARGAADANAKLRQAQESEGFAGDGLIVTLLAKIE
jgi:hypothetical protein